MVIRLDDLGFRFYFRNTFAHTVDREGKLAEAVKLGGTKVGVTKLVVIRSKAQPHTR